MEPNTILSLFNGDYTFIERPAPKNKRYADTLSKVISTEEKLEKLVEPETFTLIEKLLEYHSIMTTVELEEAFIEGFSLAVSLLLESLSRK